MSSDIAKLSRAIKLLSKRIRILEGAEATQYGGAITGHAPNHMYGETDEMDGDKLGISFEPENYTPTTAIGVTDSNSELTSHLKGIDEWLLDEDDMASNSDKRPVTQQSLLAYLGGSNARAETGTYTGDGSLDQTISTGLSNIIFVLVVNSNAGGSNIRPIFTTNDMLDDASSTDAVKLSTSPVAADDSIIQFDGGDFHVDDDGSDKNPNSNGVTYYYLAIGN